MSQQVARVSLHDVQRPVAGELELVVGELRRVIAADFPIVSEVNDHLLQMKGKLFRPTLLLLSNKAAGCNDDRAVTLAAIVELIHLATLVHDDSVDHSVLRRGLPTINALFSHQIAVIMGDYLYSRAIIELVRFDDHEALRVLARVTNEMTVGEMRQLEAHDKLAYGEGQYDALIRAKTASLLSGACEVGALAAPATYRQALALGARSVFTKPVALADLWRALEGGAPTPPAPTEHQEPSPWSPPSSGPAMVPIARVLVIDDDAAVREALGEFLSTKGYATRLAVDGVGGMAAVMEDAPDVVLLDIEMPGLNGVVALNAIRTMAPDLKVIMVSGTADADLSKRALAAGAFDYVTKPINFAYVTQSLETAVLMNQVERQTASTKPAGGRV